MLNKVSIMGRITRDLELKTTQTNGISVTSFSIACDRNYKENGADKPATDFFDVVAWRKTAEFICKYFKKGDLIAIDGNLQTRSFVDTKTNANRKAIEILVDGAHFCGGNKSKENNVPNGQPPMQTGTPAGYNDGEFNNAPNDFDPFATK